MRHGDVVRVRWPWDPRHGHIGRVFVEGPLYMAGRPLPASHVCVWFHWTEPGPVDIGAYAASRLVRLKTVMVINECKPECGQVGYLIPQVKDSHEHLVAFDTRPPLTTTKLHESEFSLVSGSAQW